MKPGSRAEFDFEQAAPDVVMGHAESDADAAAPLSGVAAVLWIPDPEQRRGWREIYIRRSPSKLNARPLGFGKPR